MTFGPALQSTRHEPFELKGSLFTLTVLRLRDTDIDAVDRLLAEKAAQAPGFFRQAPVVLELDALPEGAEPDLAALQEILRARGMVPVGVRNATAAQQAAAAAAGLAVLPEGRTGAQRRSGPAPSAPAREPNRLVTQPVRSGQQLYAPDGDLIVTGAVSPGAELLAVGNIHVYGVLRGRALAGVKGDTGARIFCQSLEAELVSVAGHYRVIEELGPDARGRSVQVLLSDGRLVIEPLGRPG